MLPDQGKATELSWFHLAAAWGPLPSRFASVETTPLNSAAFCSDEVEVLAGGFEV